MTLTDSRALNRWAPGSYFRIEWARTWVLGKSEPHFNLSPSIFTGYGLRPRCVRSGTALPTASDPDSLQVGRVQVDSASNLDQTNPEFCMLLPRMKISILFGMFGSGAKVYTTWLNQLPHRQAKNSSYNRYFRRT